MILQADSEGPDQTAQMRSLIWAFAVRICPECLFSHDAIELLVICISKLPWKPQKPQLRLKLNVWDERGNTTNYRHGSSMSENIPSDMCAQRRFRSACAFAQSDQNLHWAHFWTAKDAKFLHVDNEDWSECADAQADLFSLGAILRRYLFSRTCLTRDWLFNLQYT